MSKAKRMLSVSEAAALCGVSRGTVGYWLRSKKLTAQQAGRNYAIPVEELVFFLKSTGHKIPSELVDRETAWPYFRTLPDCWDYWGCAEDKDDCKNCIVRAKRLRVCFTAKQYTRRHSERLCHSCRYYLENYFPRLQFVHQIDAPAVVHKDLHFWGGNKDFAELCEVQETELIGMGIERVVHPDSLETLISHSRRRALDNSTIPSTYHVLLKNFQKGKLRIAARECPLKEPEGADLLIAEVLWE